MGAFSGMSAAVPTQGGLYFEVGNHVVKVNRIKYSQSDLNQKEWYIVETVILQSDTMQVGCEPSWLIEVPGKYPALSLGNIKGFLLAAFGSYAKINGTEPPTPSDIGEAETKWSFSEENPLAGVVVTAKAFNKKTREGNDFTRIKWGLPENVEGYVEQ